MTARIYQPAKSATQSGQGKDRWLLEFAPERPRVIEPLMGWTSSSDMRAQIRLTFATKDEAIAYAVKEGLAYRVEEPRVATRKTVSYLDNFRAGRIEPWSH